MGETIGRSAESRGPKIQNPIKLQNNHVQIMKLHFSGKKMTWRFFLSRTSVKLNIFNFNNWLTSSTLNSFQFPI